MAVVVVVVVAVVGAKSEVLVVWYVRECLGRATGRKDFASEW